MAEVLTFYSRQVRWAPKRLIPCRRYTAMTGSLTKVLALITSVVVATGDSVSHGLGASTARLQTPNSGPVPGPPPPPTLTDTVAATLCNPVITQSTSQTITSFITPCMYSHPPIGGDIQADNSYWRAFNMRTFVGRGQYFVNSVSFGVNSTNTTQQVTVRLYANNGGAFPGGTRTQIGTSTINVTSAQSGAVVTTPLLAVVPARTTELVMELFTPHSPTLFLVGTNTAPETGPTYWSALCTGSTPITMSQHIVFNVHGSCTTQTNNQTITPDNSVSCNTAVGGTDNRVIGGL